MKEKHLILHTGSNVGDRISNLKKANEWIAQTIGTIVQCSNLYQTEAWGVTDQPDFINQAIEVKTILSPQRVLKAILEIETKMGRIRKQKWGERLIDIDLIFYENQVIDEENLKVPHPFLQERNFVLVPLQEIVPYWVHPVIGLPVEALVNQSTDTLIVRPVTEIP